MSLEETCDPSASIYVSNRRGEARPGARVLGELGVLSLEKDLDAVKRADYCLCLLMSCVSTSSEESIS